MKIVRFPIKIRMANRLLEKHSFAVKRTVWNKESINKVLNELYDGADLEDPFFDMKALFSDGQIKKVGRYVFPWWSFGVFPCEPIDVKPLKKLENQGRDGLKAEGWITPLYGFYDDKRGILSKLTDTANQVKELLEEKGIQLRDFRQFAWHPWDTGNNTLYLSSFSISGVSGSRYVIFPAKENVRESRFDVRELNLKSNWEGSPKGTFPIYYNYEDKEERVR